MKTTSLRDIVSARIEGRWPQFAKDHPNLAAAIDRARLIDSTVAQLRRDPQFIAAMRQSHLDEKTMLNAMALVQQVERLVTRLLPL